LPGALEFNPSRPGGFTFAATNGRSVGTRSIPS
jgi:hypothetical protein